MRCKECSVTDVQKFDHSWFCSQQNDPERLKATIRAAQEQAERQKRSDSIVKRRLKEDIARWHGKFLIVKEENNALRRKVARITQNSA